jgi:hypothetical protein
VTLLSEIREKRALGLLYGGGGGGGGGLSPLRHVSFWADVCSAKQYVMSKRGYFPALPHNNCMLSAVNYHHIQLSECAEPRGTEVCF